MPNGCDCAGSCTCYITAGPGVRISGSGSRSTPYRLTADGSATHIVVADSVNIDWSLVGTGTNGDPLVLSGLATPTLPPIDIQEFTADGTWTKPVGAQVVHVLVIAGGGGGAGGAKNNPGPGGRGGGGAAVEQATLDAAALPGTVAVTVGQGGTGGAAYVWPALGACQPGADGTESSFGTYLVAQPGRGASSVSAGAGGASLRNPGGPGAGNSIVSTPVTNGSLGAAGGGEGVSQDGATFPSPGPTQVGGSSVTQDLPGGTAGSTTSGFVITPAGDGVAPANILGGGGSGGGGGGSQGGFSTGEPGGDGVRGGGGGGGGGSIGGFALSHSGAGGAGGDGVVVVVTW